MEELFEFTPDGGYIYATEEARAARPLPALPGCAHPEWGDPSSPDYIEAERLTPEWRALIGTAISKDRRTVGTLADVLDALPKADADEWRELVELADRDGIGSKADARCIEYEEAHGIIWDAYGFSLRNPATGEMIVASW